MPAPTLHLLDELRNKSPITLDIRGENAWGVAVQFLKLIESSVEDEEQQKKLISSWLRAIKNNNIKTFKQALRRYQKEEKNSLDT